MASRSWLKAVVLALAAIMLISWPLAAGAAMANGIATPKDGATASGKVDVTGYASDPNFKKWQLDLLPGGDPNAAIFLTLGFRPGDFSYSLDTTGLPNGQHALRLRVVRTDGNYTEYTNKFTIANGGAAAPAAAKDIVATAIGAGQFKTLVAAVQAAGLVEALQGKGPFTVFAPTDAAFAALPAGALDSLLKDPKALSNILLYHVLPGEVMASAVKDGLTAKTLQGSPVAFKIVNGKPMIEGANIVATDVLASNGVIHVIDKVILPPAAAAAAANGTMVKLASDAKLGSYLVDEQGRTLYLYTKDDKNVSNCYDQCATAWPPLYTAAAPTGGQGVNGSLLGTTTRKDGKTQVTYNGYPLYYWVKDQKPGDTTGQGVGGVWYVISPAGEKITAGVPEAKPAAPAAAKDIVATAIGAGQFKTLVSAVQAAGLVEALQGKGPFTVFAPTDAAFAALPAGTLDSLLKDPKALSNILLYHVLPGEVMASAVKDGLTAKTLQGSPVAFKIVNGKPMIQGANIIATDVLASNGVIHVIDKVILPPAAAAAAASNANGITSPAAGAKVSGTAEIKGVANDPNFMKWQLDVLPGGNPDAAIFLAVGNNPGEFSHAVDTSKFPNGEHALRLRVVRTDSNYSEYVTKFSVANP